MLIAGITIPMTRIMTLLTPTYYYSLKDHQGNNRVVINQSGAVQQVNHYYPFGGWFGEGVQTSNQPYKYNGKELNRQWGLDMYDYGARHYDATLGRWFTVDSRAEKYYNHSPYVYVMNNPIRFIDPDGRVVIAADINARQNIINTLSREEEQYVKFNDNGMLDVSLLNQYAGYSDNFTALHTLANSETNYIFSVADQDINGSKFFDVGSDPKNPNNFSYGVTNMPGMENDPSFNPNHTKGVVGIGSEYDSELKMNVPYFIFGNTNTKLEEQIKKVEQQAIKNYEDRNP
jgi:RHS repeat-associated core domain